MAPALQPGGERYPSLREGARIEVGLRHFLEVFNPAFDVAIPAADIGHGYVAGRIGASSKAIRGMSRSAKRYRYPERGTGGATRRR